MRSRKIRAEDARRAQVILMLAQGESFSTITAAVGCYPDYVSRWKQRFEAERLAGLRAKYRGQPATVRTPALEARVLAKTRQKPPDGSTHWTTRKLGKVLGLSHMLVARIWRRAGYQPHRFERYMLSDDPHFEESRGRDRAVPAAPHSTRWCLLSMKRRRFRRWIASIRSCRCRRGARNATDLSITGTAPCRCMRRSTPRRARSSGRRCRATRVLEQLVFRCGKRERRLRGSDAHSPSGASRLSLRRFRGRIREVLWCGLLPTGRMFATVVSIRRHADTPA